MSLNPIHSVLPSPLRDEEKPVVTSESQPIKQEESHQPLHLIDFSSPFKENSTGLQYPARHNQQPQCSFSTNQSMFLSPFAKSLTLTTTPPTFESSAADYFASPDSPLLFPSTARSANTDALDACIDLNGSETDEYESDDSEQQQDGEDGLFVNNKLADYPQVSASYFTPAPPSPPLTSSTPASASAKKESSPPYYTSTPCARPLRSSRNNPKPDPSPPLTSRRLRPRSSSSSVQSPKLQRPNKRAKTQKKKKKKAASKENLDNHQPSSVESSADNSLQLSSSSDSAFLASSVYPLEDPSIPSYNVGPPATPPSPSQKKFALWTPAEDMLICHLKEDLCYTWKAIAQTIGTHSWQAIQMRYLRTLKKREEPWSSYECALFEQALAQDWSDRWKRISHAMGDWFNEERCMRYAVAKLQNKTAIYSSDDLEETEEEEERQQELCSSARKPAEQHVWPHIGNNPISITTPARTFVFTPRPIVSYDVQAYLDAHGIAPTFENVLKLYVAPTDLRQNYKEEQ